MKHKFKSLELAKKAGDKLKGEILYSNFRAKNIKAVGEGDDEVIQISGYASTKDRDRYGDVVHPEAFKNTMEDYMNNPVLLLQHNPNKQIGVVTDYKIDKTGLKIEAEVKYKAGDEELFDKITNGDLKGFSIGFRIKELEFVEEEIDGKEVWTLHILELELLEISVVTIPANPYTLMKSIDDLLEKCVGDCQVKQAEEEEKEEEKNLKVEVKEATTETSVEENSEKEAEEDTEKTEIEKEDEADIIEESETSEESENSDESSENQEGGQTDEAEKNFTVKILEKMVKAQESLIQKNLEEKLENSLKDLKTEFEKELNSNQKELLEMVDGLLGVVEAQKNTIDHLTKSLKSFTTGKGYIYTEETEKTKDQAKTDKFLKVFAKMKNDFNI